MKKKKATFDVCPNNCTFCKNNGFECLYEEWFKIVKEQMKKDELSSVLF